MTAPEPFIVELTARKSLSPSVDLLTFLGRTWLTEASRGALRWAAGQHLELAVQGPKLRVPYSFASAPNPERPYEFELAVNHGTDPVDTLPIGAKLEAFGPFGNFTWPSVPAHSVLLIGVGTGVAPLRALLQEAWLRHWPVELLLLCGYRVESEILFREEFEKLAETHSTFRFEPTLTQPAPTWRGRRGRVQEHLSELVQSRELSNVYVCGNRAMANEALGALSALGVDPRLIRSEAY